ncbi:hypothetical protein [Clostridium weizhouense]|uniref:Uncharacterized protein n=1 Tax=Clostridium weizhouense TaxID=2859781 RepID=A0ABS7ALR7_9CLOT|nr:hypothetical protein [Clostridium weizhouense]MBW6409607.1 hypothetical protein [Clostridium weizhouense]
MNISTEKITNILSKEQDEKLLQDVLNFYLYMKQKKSRCELNEVREKVCNQYDEGEESSHFNSLIEELKLNNYII